MFTENGDGCGMCLMNKQGDVKELGKALCAAFGGRGGGKPGCFQGSLKAEREQLQRFFAER